MGAAIAPPTRIGSSFLRRPPAIVVVALFAAAVALLPAVGLNAYWQRELILIVIYGLIVSGLNITLGWAGELALGQAAIFAAGAYIGGILAMHGTTDLLIGLAAGAGAAAVVGLVSGVAGVRLGSWSLAMVSFFLILLVPDVVKLFKSNTGGLIGLTGIPQATLFGHRLSPTAFYVAVVCVAAVWFLAAHSFVHSRQGDALRVLAHSPVLARSIGLSVPRTKLVAYLVGAVPAGFAGVLYAYLQRFVSPSAFTFSLTVALLAASVIGGAHSMGGALFGAAVLELGPMRSTAFQQYSLLVYGIAMLLGGVLLSGGAVATWRRVKHQLQTSIAQAGRVPRHSTEAFDRVFDAGGVAVQPRTVVGGAVDRLSVAANIALPGRLLEVRQISKRFGGLQALNDVDVVARPGQITSIIGPNGSGKTTLLNVISGFVRPDSGTVVLDGQQISGVPAHRVGRAGVARTFQTPLVPPSLSVMQVVRTSRLSRHHVCVLASALRTPGYRRADRSDTDVALATMRAIGLAGLEGEAASSLSLGTRRSLEVARAAASDPAVLLLDEPASGLDPDALVDLGAAMVTLRDAGATIILVEHNFDFVTQLSDVIYVLAAGEVIASGSPEQIRSHPGVMESYLGQVPAVVTHDVVTGADTAALHTKRPSGATEPVSPADEQTAARR